MGSEFSGTVPVLPDAGNRVPGTSSEHSGRISDSPALGSLEHETHEKEQSCLEFQNMKIKNRRVHAKSFPKCDKQVGEQPKCLSNGG